MPKSDTWPGGIGLETMTGMDSAGSCDSVVSANSCFSDDSLEHLSAEEKACLMFLEETIESLDTEEDSGLSNDEPDQLPGPGSLATKLADLSASMSKSKLNDSQTRASKESIKKNTGANPMQSYLVPTPLVIASGTPAFVPSTKPGIPPDKNLCSKPQYAPSNSNPGHKHNQKPAAPPVPLEVNVVIPPPTKPRDYTLRTAEGPLPRGPLSYEALVHLRRSASTKKTPLCPTVDHTIEMDKCLPSTMEEPNIQNLPRPDRAHSESSKSKSSPPVVAPKPKASILVKTQSEASITSDSSYSVKHAMDPQVVRQEALQKLGLLKDQEQESEIVGAPSPPKPRHQVATTPNRLTKGPSHVNPSRSPSFCYSQLPTEPKTKPLQSSASFHHHSRHEQQSASLQHPVRSNGLKVAGPERSANDNSQRYPEPRHVPGAQQAETANKPSNAVAYTVMVVPGMGADRKEALRKLGLLKESG